MSTQETFETEIITMSDPDKLVPKSFIVKLYKVIIDEDSENKTKELERTIEYLPTRYRGKKGRYVKKS